jgi:hypothetical protein
MPSYPDAVARFVDAAEHYCELIKTPSATGDRAAFVLRVRASLSELLASGFALPDTEPSEVDLPEGPTHAEWKSAFDSAQITLGELPGGLEAYVSVPDDLADVWSDLRQGLNALAAGTRWEDVAWEWKFGLQTHWGKHAEDALVALHDA